MSNSVWHPERLGGIHVLVSGIGQLRRTVHFVNRDAIVSKSLRSPAHGHRPLEVLEEVVDEYIATRKQP